MTFSHEHADFAVAHFYFERFQIHFGGTIGHFSSANVETRVMPRALHVKSVEAAFGKRAEAMSAKFLKAVKLVIDPGDCHHLLVYLDPQCFAIAQLFGVRNGNKGGLSTPGCVFGRKMKRVLRSWGVTLMTADRDSFVVHETATEVTGGRQKANADDGEKKRQ